MLRVPFIPEVSGWPGSVLVLLVLILMLDSMRIPGFVLSVSVEALVAQSLCLGLLATVGSANVSFPVMSSIMPVCLL